MKPRVPHQTRKVTEHFGKYYNLAVGHLARRPRSSNELKDYLTKKKIDPLLIDEIISKLIEQKFLNDLAFARWWREQRTRFKGKSDRLITMELRQKGIKDDMIQEIFHEVTDEPMDDLTKAKGLVLKRLKRVEGLPPKEQYEKLGRYLIGKGFGWDIIRKAIDEHIEKKYNDGE